MEVTKAGIKPSTWTKDVECPRCTAQLKISWKDIFIKTTRKETLFSSKHVIHYYIKCKECGRRIELNEKTLPYVIKKKVFDNMNLYDMLLNFYFT